MAIDTENKRRSALHCGPPFLPMFPVADGTIAQADRQTATWQYAGILAGSPAEATTAVQRYVGGGGWDGGMFEHVRVSSWFLPFLVAWKLLFNLSGK